MLSAAAFDDSAATYDDAFTESTIGRLLRAAVWRRLDAQFRAGDRVLELNCGTGADAIHLAQRGVHVLATDVSEAMLAVTRRKVAQAGMEELVQVAKLDIADLAAWGSSLRSETRDQRSQDDDSSPSRDPISDLRPPVSGLLSNFGGLNCVADLAGVAQALAGLLKPGGRAILCIMGPLAPWEWAWYLRQGQVGKAFRRLRRDGVPWRGLTIRYPSIAALRRAFAPMFTVQRVSAIGALLPPSYVEPWAARHPALLARLNRIERRLETAWPLPWLADHYLIEMVLH
ncbi:methyltransferase domain-containing protein [Candidatus Amarolinea dominans]|uniref:class I SAM-dependent methyltransferase n=1 Tax=Candidatus Amarolinea dominans TaxID=3140696 RepID=UPI001D8C9C19|nr:methyltransferase domain-containing protein [Anaerolineae bacterium]